MERAGSRPVGWSPSPAQQRWAQFQNTLKFSGRADAWPSDERVRERFDELVSIATQMADEHDAIFKVITDMRGPWIVLKHDLNRLTALFGPGLASTNTSDPAILEPIVRRRLEEIATADGEPAASEADTGTGG